MPKTLAVMAPVTQEQAAKVVRDACDDRMTTMVVHVGERRIELPEGLSRFLVGVIEHAAQGDTLSFATRPEELTSTAAADLVGVSRPTLMKMAREGRIPSTKVGSHTRFRTADVTEFLHKRSGQRAAAFKELRQIDDELGID